MTTASKFRLLVLNPNSSEGMSEGMKKAIATIPGLDVELEFYTAPKDSPASINDGDDLATSTKAVLSDIDDKIASFDGALVACYSVHPLVGYLATRYRGQKAILGIFEASVLAALTLTKPYPTIAPSSPGRSWGVVTTGKFWEEHLGAGVRQFLGQKEEEPNVKFAGVFSTGLDAGDFHGGVSPEVIRAKLKDATKRLLATGRVGCVVMGCAGMAGLEDIIRSAITEEYGEATAPQDKVYIIDGVKAGVGLLLETVRNERLFGQ